MSVLPAPPAEAELVRREMLAHADRLLDAVEELRLAQESSLPPTLREAIRSLQLRIDRAESSNPRTVRAAQLLVFAVQQRLMAANPRHRHPRSHLGRAGGTPRVTTVERGVEWKELTLPPAAPAGQSGPSTPAALPWSRQVELVVERAFDRWSLAQNQAVAAARSSQEAGPAVARARAAWSNYWDLRCEAERLLLPALASSERNSAAVTGSADLATRAAKPSRNAPRVSSSTSSASAMTAAAASVSPGARTCSSSAAKSSGSV
ncbi:hypothetical protein [Candidatus Nephthysia bennettiae]|uniref:Uncharacterized protein n=1 Tax=Candidatus Nephthysia bennettiae TaxID=3127016 RepID=A0A934K775_9BACT|nr:hypothetical protein [Candidatus Dormibacteraeota bacterium]